MAQHVVMPGSSTVMSPMPVDNSFRVDASSGLSWRPKVDGKRADSPDDHKGPFSFGQFALRAPTGSHFLNRVYCDLLWTPLPIHCVSVLFQIYWVALWNVAEKDGGSMRNILILLVSFFVFMSLMGAGGATRMCCRRRKDKDDDRKPAPSRARMAADSAHTHMNMHFVYLRKFRFDVSTLAQDGADTPVAKIDGTTSNASSCFLAVYNLVYLVLLLYTWFDDLFYSGNPCGNAEHSGHKLFPVWMGIASVLFYIVGEFHLVNAELGLRRGEGLYFASINSGMHSLDLSDVDFSKDDSWTSGTALPQTSRHKLTWHSGGAGRTPSVKHSGENCLLFLGLLLTSAFHLWMFSALTDYRQHLMLMNTCDLPEVADRHVTVRQGYFAMGRQYESVGARGELYTPCPLVDTCDELGAVPVPHLDTAARTDTTVVPSVNLLRAQDQWDEFVRRGELADLAATDASFKYFASGNLTMLTGFPGSGQERADCGYSVDITKMNRTTVGNNTQDVLNTFVGPLSGDTIAYESLQHCRPGGLTLRTPVAYKGKTDADVPKLKYESAEMDHNELIGQKLGVNCPFSFASVTCCAPVYDPTDWTCSLLNVMPFLTAANSPVCNCNVKPTDWAPVWKIPYWFSKLGMDNAEYERGDTGYGSDSFDMNYNAELFAA
jgi:hypothetical protein